MTTADFIAICFWPLVILFTVLLSTVREPVLQPTIGLLAVLLGISSLILWVAYGRSSIIAIIDWYLFVIVLGVGLVWWGGREWYLFRSIQGSALKACVAVLGGAAVVFFVGNILIKDFFQSPIVIEGRVQNLRTTGTRNTEYVADVAGHTVKVTMPVYERLKFLPVVRVEVGRGSNYVYTIEYLAN
ncbi:hypothetical protein CQ14_40850 [Bradyrhizobium lablabi]|uniref:DUF4131 domain-containing protein n=1 Tax=Bradyrhizobium lablabi TaxID=722472 RepID=A0A0R3NDB9_9BRAD|nr:hypothetical protein [Bradyrhizobium lablabi]KRR28367.1 hypothetical protein CQ14_40850 [Bradyrhizobium lablabi]